MLFFNINYRHVTIATIGLISWSSFCRLPAGFVAVMTLQCWMIVCELSWIKNMSTPFAFGGQRLDSIIRKDTPILKWYVPRLWSLNSSKLCCLGCQFWGSFDYTYRLVRSNWFDLACALVVTGCTKSEQMAFEILGWTNIESQVNSWPVFLYNCNSLHEILPNRCIAKVAEQPRSSQTAFSWGWKWRWASLLEGNATPPFRSPQQKITSAATA